MENKIVIVLVLLVSLCIFAFSQEIRINNTTDWTRALDTIANGGNNKSYTLIINGRIAVPGDYGVDDPNVADFYAYSFSFGNTNNINVTLRGNGTLYLSSPGYMFRIKGGQTFTIDSEQLTLQGLTTRLRGTVTNNHSSIIDMMADSNHVGGNLNLINGTLNLNTIQNGGHGGAVTVGYGGTFTMSGGRISENMTIDTFGGGGVHVAYGGNFIMTGGIITSNISTTRDGTSGTGGGVCVMYGNFVKTGGIIYGNNAAEGNENLSTYGHAVYYITSAAHDGGYFFYCDNTLDSTNNGNIRTTDTLPSRNGQTVGNWSRNTSPR